MPQSYSTDLPFINGAVNPLYVAWLSTQADGMRATIGCLNTPLIAPWKPIMGQLGGSNPANPAINAIEDRGAILNYPFISDDPGFKQAIPPQGSPNPSA